MFSILHPSIRRTLPTALLGLVLLFPALGAVGIINGDEARFAQAAREMRASAEWILPSFAGQPRYDKPILIYWATILSYEIFGETPFAARFPSALATLAAALLLACFAGKRWGPKMGFKAAALFLLSPLIFLEAHACTADALNNLWILSCMLCLFTIRQEGGGVPARVFFWISLGLGMLSKGPVILLVLGGSLLAMQALRRSWKRGELFITAALMIWALGGGGPLPIFPVLMFLGLEFILQEIRESQAFTEAQWSHWIWGPAVLLAIVLPWALAAEEASRGAFFRVAIGHHVLQRSLSTLEHHQGFPGIYILAIFVLGFPWAAQLPAALRKAWDQRRNSGEILFLLGWVLGPLILLESLKTRLVHYELPVFAGAILLILALEEKTQSIRPARSALLACSAILAVTPLLPVYYFHLSKLLPLAGGLALLIFLPSVSLALRPLSAIRWKLTLSAAGIFLIGLFAVYLPKFSREFIAPATIAKLRTIAAADDAISLYKLRDEDLLFSLGMEHTTVLRSNSELESVLHSGAPGLLIIRQKDFMSLPPGFDTVSLLAVGKVRGIDLGRGRFATTLLFRFRTAGVSGENT